MDLKLKRAQENDAQTLTDLGKATFIETFAKDNTGTDMAQYISETFDARKQLAEIKDPKRFIEIAWVDNQAAGFLHLLNGTPDPSVVGEKPLEILRLYVASKWHGKGVGALLMNQSIEIARAQGFKTLWLGVWENNFRAQAFYKKFGFTTVGSHIFRLGSDKQIDLIMVRSV